MALRDFENSLVRMRSLMGSLRVVIVCAQDLNDRSDALGAAVFLTNEVTDQIDSLEAIVLGCILPTTANDEK